MRKTKSPAKRRASKKNEKPAPFWARRGGLCHVEIRTSDLAAAAKFYGAVFGWVARPNDAKSIFFALPDEGEALCPMALEGKPRAGSTLVYVNVGDIGATLARASKLGASVIRGETDLGGHGACAEMRAPDGNVFGLWRA